MENRPNGVSQNEIWILAMGLSQRMSRGLFTLLAISLLMAGMPLKAATIAAGTATSTCGADVQVGLTATDIPAFISLSFVLSYDASRLSYVRAAPSGALAGWTFTPTESPGRVSVVVRPPSRLTVTGPFAVVTFEVIDRSSATPILLTVSDVKIQLAIGVSIEGAGSNGAIQPQCTATASPAGIVFRHLAGSSAGPGGAEGQGSQARFGYVYGVVAKPDGTLYVADEGNYTIRRVTPGGMVSTIAGRVGHLGTADGQGADARFLAPYDIANARDGVFVLDEQLYQTTSRIRHVSSAGVVRTIAQGGGVCWDGQEPFATSSLCDPIDAIASDAADNVYVLEETRIRRIAPDGTIASIAGVPGLLQMGFRDGKGADARFDGRAASMALGPDGNLYIYEPLNQAVRRVTPDGETTTLISGPPLPGYAQSSAIAVGPDGAIYVNQVSEVYRIDASGIRVVAHVAWPTGRRFALDPRGDLVVPLYYGTELWRLLFSESRVERIAGHGAEYGVVDGAGDGARFNDITALAYNAHDGKLYVADQPFSPEERCLIRVVTLDGQVRTMQTSQPVCASHLLATSDGTLVAIEAGDGPITAWRIAPDGRVTRFADLPDNCHAANVGSDGQDNIYLPCVASSLNGPPFPYIAKLHPNGSVTVAAEGVSGEALTVLPSGDLIVADHFRLVRVTPAGSTLPFAGSGLFPLQADGTLTDASFGFMLALAPGPSGSVYAMDTGLGNWVLLRYVTSTGEVSTIAGAGIGTEDGNGTTARFVSPAAIVALPNGDIVIAEPNALRIGTKAGNQVRRRAAHH
jgi:hypothetical protein